MVKSKFVRETWATVLKEMTTDTPDSQIDADLLVEMKNYLLIIDTKSDQEIYDYLVNISKNSGYQTSSFIKKVFALDQYYERPE